MGQDVPDDVNKPFLSEGGIPSVDPSVKDSQDTVQRVPSTPQHHLSPVSTIDASDYREGQPCVKQASIILHGGVVRSTPSMAGNAPCETQSEQISSINIEGEHRSHSEWSLDLKATATSAGDLEYAGGFADDIEPSSKQDCRSAEAAKLCVSSEAQQRITATCSFAVAARATTGTFDRELDLILYEAIGAAQSRRGSTTAVDSQTDATAAVSDARATSGPDSTENVCVGDGSAQACQFSYAAQENLSLKAVTATGARGTPGTDDMEMDRVLHEALGAVQSRRGSAAAQGKLKVTTIPAASTRVVFGTDDGENDVMLGEAISSAPSRHGSAAAHMHVKVPGASLITGTNDRGISSFLHEAVDMMQDDAGSNSSKDVLDETKTELPLLIDMTAFSSTSERQGSTSSLGYSGMQCLQGNSSDELPVLAQASIAHPVSEVLVQWGLTGTGGQIPYAEERAATEALLKAAEETAALPTSQWSGQHQEHITYADWPQQRPAIDPFGATLTPTAHSEVPSSSAPADQAAARLAGDLAILGFDPQGADAARLPKQGSSERPDQTAFDNTGAGPEPAKHKQGGLGDAAAWQEVLLLEPLQTLEASYNLEQFLREPDWQRGGAGAGHGWAGREAADASPSAAGRTCRQKRPPSRLGSARRVPHRGPTAERQHRDARCAAVQPPVTLPHGWDDSPLSRQAPPRPRSRGQRRHEGRPGGGPPGENAFSWLLVQAATLQDAWPASGETSLAPRIRPQTAAPRRRHAAAPEQAVAAAGPLCQGGASSSGRVPACRLSSGLGGSPQQWLEACRPPSAATGVGVCGNGGLFSTSSPRPASALRRPALGAHKGPPAQTDRVVRHQRMQQAWARDRFLCSGAAGANAAGKRKMLGFAEAFAEVHAANDRMRRLYVQLTVVGGGY